MVTLFLRSRRDRRGKRDGERDVTGEVINRNRNWKASWTGLLSDTVVSCSAALKVNRFSHAEKLKEDTSDVFLFP